VGGTEKLVEVEETFNNSSTRDGILASRNSNISDGWLVFVNDPLAVQ
jgi:hypothetical protein